MLAKEKEMRSKENGLTKINIPSYSFKQEKFNSVSHYLGIPLGIATIVLAIILFSINSLSPFNFVGLLVFGLSIVLLYYMSGSYHSESATNEKSKKIKRIIDHCTIYVLIAGTYTPICIYISSINIIGIILLVIEWVLAIFGIIINAIDFSNKVFQGISMFLYLALGWLVLFTGSFIYLPSLSFTWILIGGILYTIGSILYGIGHKNLSFHSIFHVFVLLGTITQSVGVLLLYL